MIFPGPATLSLFTGVALALLVVPGPAVLYIVARSVDQGRTAGLVSTLGIAVGTSVHVIAAALGLSAVLATSAAAFEAVRYVGAAYLVWLGIRRFMEPDTPEASPDGGSHRLVPIFRQGVVVNILNPKTALFFLAFLPQFVEPARGPLHLQVIFFGAVFIMLSLISDSAWALAAGAAGDWLRRSPGAQGLGRYLSAGVYVALGVGAAVSGGRKIQ